MVQTSVDTAQPRARAGLIADLAPLYIESLFNGESSSIPFGIAVAQGAGQKAALPASAASKMLGISAFSHEHEQQTREGPAVLQPDEAFGVCRFGTVNVVTENACVKGGKVYARITSDGGSNTQLGSIRSNNDAGRAVLLPGCEFLGAASAGETVAVWVDLLGEGDGEIVVFGDNNASLTDDSTVAKFIVPAGRTFLLEAASYFNATGLAQDAANYFDIKVVNGATVMANWSTQTGQEGTIAAATTVNLTNGTPANRTAAAGSVISVFYDETGAATLPAGTLTFTGRLL
jgi:hypothetical protein